MINRETESIHSDILNFMQILQQQRQMVDNQITPAPVKESIITSQPTIQEPTEMENGDEEDLKVLEQNKGKSKTSKSASSKSKKIVLKPIAEEDSEVDQSIPIAEYKALLKKIHADLKMMKIGQK